MGTVSFIRLIYMKCTFVHYLNLFLIKKMTLVLGLDLSYTRLCHIIVYYCLSGYTRGCVLHNI